MRYILSILTIAILIAGCESKEEIQRAKDAEIFKETEIKKVEEIYLLKTKKIKQAEKEALLREEEMKKSKLLAQKEADRKALEAEEKLKNPSIMNNLGISMDSGKLIIDTNRAKEFFGVLKKNLNNVDREIKDGNVTITKPIGIEINENKINIDLNKTETYIEKLSEKVEKFSKKFDNFRKTLNSDKNSTKE